eukprot:gene11948-5349_t
MSVVDKIDDDAFKKIEEEKEDFQKNVNQYFKDTVKISESVLHLYRDILPMDFIQPLKQLFELVKSVPVEDIQDFIVESDKVSKSLSTCVKEGDFKTTSMIPLFNFGGETTDNVSSENETQNELVNFIQDFMKLIHNLQQSIPSELIEFILKSFEDLNEEVFLKFMEAIKESSLEISKTSKIIDTLKLSTTIEIFSSYFDHFDQNNDGKLSIDEIADIGAWLEFQKKGMNKTEIISQIKKDSKKLISEVQSMKLNENIIAFVSSIDFSPLNDLIPKIISLNKKCLMDPLRILKFKQTLNDIINFFDDYKPTLEKLLKPQNTGLWSFLTCIEGESGFLTQSIFLFQELSSMIDLKLISKNVVQLMNLLDESKIFNSIEYIERIKIEKETLKALFDSCKDLYPKIMNVFSIAVERSLMILDLDLNDLKEACLDAFDNDGDGKVDMSDLKSIFDQDKDGDVDLKDIMNGVSSLFKKKSE